jgi:hypothetical protein
MNNILIQISATPIENSLRSLIICYINFCTINLHNFLSRWSFNDV